MLDRLGHRLTLAIGLHGLTLVRQQGWLRHSHVLLARQAWDEPLADADLVQALDATLASCKLRQLPVAVVLADPLVRTWRVQPPKNAAGMKDCEAAAAMRFSSIFEEAPEDWVIACAPAGIDTFLAFGVKRSLERGLRHVLQSRGLPLTSMTPEFVALWNHWEHLLPAENWFGVCTPGGLGLGIVEGQRLAGLRQLQVPLPAQATAEWLAESVRREADRINLPAPKGLALCGNAPAHWLARNPQRLACSLLGSQCDAPSLFGVAA